MVLIKGQAQFNYVKYYPIRSRWVLIDQKKFVRLLFLTTSNMRQENNKLPCVSKSTYMCVYIYIYRNSQITDYIKVRSHLRINYVDDVQILSKSRVFFYSFSFFFFSTIFLLLLCCSSEDINEVKKNNRNGKELRLMIIMVAIESERACHTMLE